MSIGARIVAARTALGWDQSKLASILESRGIMTQQTLSRLESGKNETTRKLVEVAAVLGVRAEWLQSGAGSMWVESVADDVLFAPVVARLMRLEASNRLTPELVTAFSAMLDAIINMPNGKSD